MDEYLAVFLWEISKITRFTSIFGQKMDEISDLS